MNRNTPVASIGAPTPPVHIGTAYAAYLTVAMEAGCPAALVCDVVDQWLELWAGPGSVERAPQAFRALLADVATARQHYYTTRPASEDNEPF